MRFKNKFSHSYLLGESMYHILPSVTYNTLHKWRHIDVLGLKY